MKKTRDFVPMPKTPKILSEETKKVIKVLITYYLRKKTHPIEDAQQDALI